MRKSADDVLSQVRQVCAACGVTRYAQQRLGEDRREVPARYRPVFNFVMSENSKSQVNKFTIKRHLKNAYAGAVTLPEPPLSRGGAQGSRLK